ncbi:MAG: hypothetical protein QOD84_2567 [Acidobacteriaceae bacterium]
MRTFLIVFVVVFCAALTIAFGQNMGDSRAAADAEIRAADKAGLKAAQAKNIDGAVANYASDASWLPPHAPIVQGKEAIRAAWASMLATPDLKIEWQITKLEISPSGEMGYTLYKYDMTMQGPTGQPIHDVGKDMAVWKKESDGKWKIIADTFNSDLPLPSSPGK